MSPRRLRSLVLVGVVMCLAAAGIAAAVTVRGAASGRVDAEFDRNHGPDLVFYVAADRASDTARLLSADPHVRGTGRPVASADATIVGGEQAIPVELRAAQAPGSLNAPVIVTADADVSWMAAGIASSAPAENPMIPILFGSIRQSFACARTMRIA